MEKQGVITTYLAITTTLIRWKPMKILDNKTVLIGCISGLILGVALVGVLIIALVTTATELLKILSV